VRTGRPGPRFSPEALQLLARHRWPGNVRELANIVERLAILRPGQEVTAPQVRDLLAVDRGEDRAVTADTSALPDAALLERPLTEQLDVYERQLILRALSMSNGNMAEAARRLQTDRPNLYRRMRRLGIAPQPT